MKTTQKIKIDNVKLVTFADKQRTTFKVYRLLNGTYTEEGTFALNGWYSQPDKIIEQLRDLIN